MGAPGSVVWSREAELDLARIHRFVQQQWSDRMAERFLDLVMEFEDVVLQYPRGFKTSPIRPDLHIGIIHRNVSAIYSIEPDHVLIVSLIDTRADNAPFL